MTTSADSLRPTTWAGYIGQEKLKERLMIHIEAALEEKRTLGHVLLLGKAGTGKTTLAALIAQAMGDEFMTAEMPMNDSDLRDLRGFTGVLFLDELHRGSQSQQEELLPLLEHGYMRPKGKFRMDFGWLTVIGATTEGIGRGKVIKPLGERFLIRPAYEEYSLDEMAQIAAGQAAILHATLSEDDLRILARAAGGAPRTLSSLINTAHDIEVGSGPTTAAEVLKQMRLTIDGLNPEHVEYLGILFNMDAPVGLPTLKALLGQDESTILQMEAMLIGLDLLCRTGKGRELTTHGSARIRQLNGSTRP